MSASKIVRVGVAGVGNMGVNHARIYAMLQGAQLAAVFDVDAVRAAEVAARYGGEPTTSLERFIELVDAASVAVPTSLHAAVARPLLESGRHCLVEKPLADSEADCIAMIEAAARGGSRLLVGHVERFNPAVEQLGRILEAELPVFAIDTRRMSAASSRIDDVDVSTDLMVHDLDVVRWLVPGEVISVHARGVRVRHGAGYDYVSATLGFDSGAMATLTASRITPSKIRELHVTSEFGFIRLDYMTQELCIFRQSREATVNRALAARGSYVLDLLTDQVLVRRNEPLVAELAHFLDVILREESPRVGAEDALDTMRLLWRVQHALH